MRNRLLVALLVCSTPLFGAAVPAIQVKDLGDLGGVPNAVHVAGFGRNGTLVGGTFKPGIGPIPFAWTPEGGFTIISESAGFAIAANGGGQAVGQIEGQGFLWTPPNSLSFFSNPLAYAIEPQAINDLGQVAGVMDLLVGERHAFLWTAQSGFKDLGSLGGYFMRVSDLSENGHVVGEADDANGETRAFLSKNGGKIKNLGTLGGSLSIATAVNDEGTVVGGARTADNNIHAFVYRNNQMTALASFSPESYAYGVNSSGTVVGHSITFGHHDATVWSPAGAPQIIPGADIAVGVNDAGIVAVYDGLDSGETTRAYLWASGSLLTPDGTEHDQTSQAVGVTAAGALVSLRQDWAGEQKGFYWKPGTSRQFLDGVGGGQARALVVNASGKIAGISRTKEGYDRAFVWTPNSTGGGAIQEVPAPAGWHSTPVAINAAGAVVGSTAKPLSGFQTSGPSFYWSGTGTEHTDLGQVTAVDLNDVGQVLGYAYPTSAFVWKSGAFTPLPAMGEGSIVPYDINNKGQVVGRFNVDAWTIHAFSWKPGTPPADLGTLGGSYSEAVAVNDNGQIAGNSSLPNDPRTHAFRTSVGKPLTDLGSIFAGGFSTAVAMNKNGHVAGNADFDGSTFNAFLNDNRMRNLGTLSGPDGGVQDVNDLKDVVGWRLVEPFWYPTAFASVGAGPLADLPSLGGENSRAFAVNAAGVAVGDCLNAGGYQRAVLWRLR
ncbi:MAG TPA: hypothetical protein VF950_02950 [Planctomycetota bacterium]